VLLVDDDRYVLRGLTRSLAPVVGITVADSYDAGLRIIESDELIVGGFVDLNLGSGPTGLDLVERARKVRPLLDLVMLTAYHEPQDINRAALLGVPYLCKPVTSAVIHAHARRMIDPTVGLRARLRMLCEALGRERGLSPSQVQVLELAVQGLERSQTATLLAITDETVKSHRKAIAVRCGQPFDSVVLDLRRATWGVAPDTATGHGRQR
jgi:DNA-binding NarL/FixJ family response regulator